MSPLAFGSACTSFVIVLICPSVLICFVLEKSGILYTIVIYIAQIKNRGTCVDSCGLKNKCFLYCIVPIHF